MSEANNETNQPNEAVEASLEESQSTPQDSDKGEELFFADDEGDHNQPNSNMTQEQTYAAWRKEQEKRKRKNEELEKEREERERLQREIEELKSQVSTVARGSKPTLASCDFDEEAYEQALDKWYSHGTTKPAQSNNQQTQQSSVQPQHNSLEGFEDAEFYHHLKSTELKSKLSDYDDYEAKAKQTIGQYGVDPEQFTVQLAAIAHDAEVDIAKAMYAFGRQPALVQKLSQARTQVQMAKVLKEAAGKIQTRERKALDTKPTPTISGGGTIDNHASAVAKAKEQWMKSGSVTDYQKYKAAKDANK